MVGHGRASSAVVLAAAACLAAAAGAAVPCAGAGCPRPKGGRPQPSQPARTPVQAVDASHASMLRRLAELAERHPVTAPFLRDVVRQRARLQALSSHDAQTAYATALRALAQAELRAGMTVEAIDHLQQAIENMRGIRGSARLRLTLASRFWLGVARLRLLEQRLCGGASAPACVVPLTPRPDTRDDALAAAEHLRATMDLSPGSHPLHEAARWLLNVAAMMLGEYPGALKASERIPLPATDTPVRFHEIGVAAGLRGTFLAGGLVVDDFDGDGWFDVVASSHDLRAPLRVFRNVAGRSFEHVAAGLEGITGGRGLVQADFDGDGDLDLFVARGGVLGRGSAIPDSLLRNDGNLRFTDVSDSVGLNGLIGPSWGAAWADYDLDGDPDLFVARGLSGERGPAAAAPDLAASALLRNDGGTFADVSGTLDSHGPLSARAGTWADYDGDGDPDLFVATIEGPVRLLRNDRGRFRDVTEATGLAGARDALGVWFADFDGDGTEELLLLRPAPTAEGPPPVWRFAAWRTGAAVPGPSPALYRHERGGFVEATARFGLAGSVMALGAGFGDLDDDGRLDLHVGAGYPAPEALLPDLTFVGTANGLSLLPVTAGLASLEPGNAVAFADWDRDGDQDLFVQAGHYRPAQERRILLFDNGGVPAGRSYVALALRGTRADRGALGATVQVVSLGPAGERVLVRRVGASSAFGAAPLELHVGIDRGERVAAVRVRWPGTRRFVSVTGVRAGGRFQIVQGERAARALPPPSAPPAERAARDEGAEPGR